MWVVVKFSCHYLSVYFSVFFVIQVINDQQIENLLSEIFSSEEENDEDDPYLDYVPKPFNARLNEIQGM